MSVPGDTEGVRLWRMTDRRQIETHRLLRLFGDAPATHFRDACRMMAGADLQTTTHLVAHSLRECEAALRGVLSSMLSEEQRIAVDAADMKHRAQIQEMCTLLGFGGDDEIRSQWWGWAERLHELTHRHSLRAPRPVDDEFRGWWAQGQAVLAAIVRQFETVYGEALPSLERLASKETPVEDDVRELRERVPHGDVALAHFFELVTPGWFQLLREAGYFTHPPPLQPDEEGRVAYIPWPPGVYLVRLASDPQYQSEVIALARELDETDNPAAREAIVDIALAAPPEEGVTLAEQIAGFLASPYQWRLPFKVRDLVLRFAGAGQLGAALGLLRPLVRPSTPAGEGWRAVQLLDELVPTLFPAAGMDGLGLVADLLDEQLDGDAPTRDNDYSYIWRPTLEGGRRRDYRDAAVSALRDAATNVVQAHPGQLVDVIALLERRPRSIFARLALDLLRRFPDEELVATRLGDRTLFSDFNLEREWSMLAEERFSDLPNAVRESILVWVEAGPEDAADTDDTERWRLHQLMRLGDELPAEWRARRDALIERYGQPDRGHLGVVVWSGDTAPLTKDELSAMAVDAVVDYLATWTPEARFDGPSQEGLARLLGDVVAEDPARFAAEAERFLDVEPTYVRNFVAALIKAVQEGREIEWRAILAFAAGALERPRLLDGRSRDGNALDPGWTWTRTEIARLLAAGMQRRVLSIELADGVWTVLAALAEDDEPTLAYEEKWTGGLGPEGLALNTVRGSAMHAIMQYAWWRKEQPPEGDTPTLEPRLRELLDRRLDLDVESTRTVRAVYGQWFPFLLAADDRWATAHVDDIFALEGPQAPLGRVAWDSYLLNNQAYDSAFEELRPQYVAAIGRAAAREDGDEEMSEALIGHLISLFVRGRIELDDEFLGLFFAEAPVELRSRLINVIGIDVTNADEIPQEPLDRLRALLESRMEAAMAAGGDALRELRGFSWWFGSGKFDDDWSLNQLTRLLDSGGSVEFDHVVVERLNELRETWLPVVVRALGALIESSEDPWFVLGSRDEIHAILNAGLNSDDEAVRQDARRAASRLIARGHPEFRDLLN